MIEKDLSEGVIQESQLKKLQGVGHDHSIFHPN